MVYVILIVIFLIIAALSFGMLKLIKYYSRLCATIEPEDKVAIKTTGIYKNSLIFFLLLNLVFLLVFLISRNV